MIRIFYIALLLLMVSCEHQQPQGLHADADEDPRTWVKVVFDWTECPEADPEYMELYFIPTDGGHYFRYSFPAREEARMYIPKGHYSLVALNSDCENIRVKNPDRYDTFTIALRGTDDSSSKTVGTDSSDDESPSESLLTLSDYLWTSWIDDIEVSDEDIIVPMSEAFCRYSVEILNFSDIHRISSVQGVLYGNHQAIGFNGAADGYDSCGMIFTLGKDPTRYPGPNNKNIRTTMPSTTSNAPEGTFFYGEFLTLGHCGRTRTGGEGSDDDRPHSILLRYKLTDGRIGVMTVDVTDQVHAQPVERCHIVLDALKLPTPEYSSGNVSLQDWNVIDLNVSGC